MAVKNHELDDRIMQAAMEEFLEHGYESTSLRKIASGAGVTFGAIYTRYATKDALFCALVQPLLDQIRTAFASLRSAYYAAVPELQSGGMEHLIVTESEVILHLLFDDYDRAVLLLCRSAGSSLERFFDQIINQKIRETLRYFQLAGICHLDERVLRLLIGGQFHMYFEIIRGGYSLSAAKEMMHAAMLYHTGGWMALLSAQNHKLEGEHEI